MELTPRLASFKLRLHPHLRSSGRRFSPICCKSTFSRVLNPEFSLSASSISSNFLQFPPILSNSSQSLPVPPNSTTKVWFAAMASLVAATSIVAGARTVCCQASGSGANAQPAALPLRNRELARATGLNRREVISRMMVASGAALLSATAGADAAHAAKGEIETAEEAATNPLIQKLLATSKANKAANDAARLEDYYRRNFKEYFEFVEGSVINKKEMTPAEKAIVEWLAKNR